MPNPGDDLYINPGKYNPGGGFTPPDNWYNPIMPPGYTPPDSFLPGGNIVPAPPAPDPIGEWVKTLLPPQKSQRVSSKLVGAKSGTADLTGVGDLLANLSFQRLWDSYNPSKDPVNDFTKAFEGNNTISHLQGDNPGGYVWGYIDPTWLPGFDPGKRVTTIEDILTPMYKNVWQETAPEPVPVPPPPPPTRAPNNERPRKPLPI